MVDAVTPHHSFRETSLTVFDVSNCSTSASNNSVLFFLDMVLDKRLFFLPAAGSFSDLFAVFLLCFTRRCNFYKLLILFQARRPPAWLIAALRRHKGSPLTLRNHILQPYTVLDSLLILLTLGTMHY